MKKMIARTFKRVLGVSIIFAMIFSIAACGNSKKQQAITQDAEQQVQNNPDAKTLVVYFSWSGNTQKVANKIKEETNADIFRIITEESYPEDYDETVDKAKKEHDENARPKLSTHIDNLNQYDTIFIGYPNWWYDMPMPLYTFFDEYDLSGKKLIPFCTNGGSGFSDTINSIKEAEPNADLVEDGLAIRDTAVDKSDNDITNWLKELEIK